MAEEQRVYGAGDVAKMLGISPAGLRRLAVVYERVHGQLPRDDRGRLWPEDAVSRLEAARQAVREGRAASTEAALVAEEGGEGVQHHPVPRSASEANLASLLEELRGLRAAVERQNELLEDQGRRLASLEAPQEPPEGLKRTAEARGESDGRGATVNTPSGDSRGFPVTATEDEPASPHAPSLSRGAILAALLPRPRQKPSRKARFWVVINSVGLALISFVLGIAALPGIPSIFYTLAANGPLILGFWLSIRWLGRHKRSYVFYGLIVGLAMCGVLTAIWIADVATSFVYSGNLWERFIQSFGEYVGIVLAASLGPALLFVAGGLLGDLLKGWAAQRAPAGEYPAEPDVQALSNQQTAWATIVVGLITLFGNLMVPVLNWLLGTQP